MRPAPSIFLVAAAAAADFRSSRRRALPRPSAPTAPTFRCPSCTTRGCWGVRTTKPSSTASTVGSTVRAAGFFPVLAHARRGRACPRADRVSSPLVSHSYFWFAHEEGLFRPNTSTQAGIRCVVVLPFGLLASPFIFDGRTRSALRPFRSVPCDYEANNKVGFTTVVADEIEDIGFQGVVDRILERVGDNPVCAPRFVSLRPRPTRSRH